MKKDKGDLVSNCCAWDFDPFGYEGDKENMEKGKVDHAIRRALTIYDKWNDITGFPQKYTSYYYEIQSIIEDAVHCGIQEALGINEKLESEKENL